MRTNFKYICLALILGLASPIWAQDGVYVEVQDFESWTSAELKYKLNKTWSFGLQQQFRFDNNSTELKGYFTQFRADYRINKHFDFGLGLRYITRNDNEGKVQGLENYFRYHVDGSYKHKLDRFSLSYRIRYQNRNELGVKEEEGDVPNKYIRLRAKVKYNIKNWKLDPFVSGEFFNHIDDDVNMDPNHYRITAGTDFSLKKFGRIGLYYRMEQEIQTNYPKTIHSVRFKYTYTIKHKKDE